MSKQISPLPWVAVFNPQHNNTMPAASIIGYGNDERGLPIVADIPPRTVDGAHEANAEFIVRAANSHDKLVAALKKLVRLDADPSSATSRGWLDAFAEARAALAAVEAA